MANLPHNLVLAIIVMGLTLAASARASAWSQGWLRRVRYLDPNEDILIGRALSFGLLWIGASLVLSLTGSTSLGVFSFATIGLVLGLGFQNIIDAIIKGLYLVAAHELHPGDTVLVSTPTGGMAGAVERVSLRATWLRTLDGDLIPVPNTTLFTNTYIILSQVSRERLAQGAPHDPT